MMAFRSLVTVCRVLLVLIVLVTVVIAITSLDRGLNIDTSLSDIVPVASGTESRAQAIQQAQDMAEQGIVLMIESVDSDQLRSAGQWLDTQLASMSGLMQRSDMAAANEQALNRIVDELTPHRFHLLSPSDRDALHAQEPDELLDQALADLYSPGGALRLLPRQEDPFNFLTSFIVSGLSVTGPGITGPESATTAIDAASMRQDVIHNDNPPYRLIRHLRLFTAISELQEQSTLATFFNELDQSLSREYPAVRLLRTGVLFFANEAATSAKKDINLVSGGSVIGLLLLLLMVFRSVWPVVTTALSVAVGVLFAFAVVSWFYGSIHVFTIVFGASLIGIVIDYTIHFYYHRALTATGLTRRFSHLHRALLLSLLTSVAAYSALMWSSVAMLQKVAVFSVSGISAAWITVLAVASITRFESVTVRRQIVSPLLNGLTGLTSTVAQHCSVKAVAVVFSVMAVAVVLFSRGQDDPRRFVELSESLLLEGAEIGAVVRDLEPGRFLLVEGAQEQALFEKLSSLYAETSTAARLISVLDWLPSPEQQQKNYAALDSVYRPDGAAPQLFSVMAADPAYASALYGAYQSAQGDILSATDFFATLKPEVSSLVISTQTGVTGIVLIGKGAELDVLEQTAMGMDGVEYVDTVSSSTAELRRQRLSSSGMLILAYIAVGILMLLVYRRRQAVYMLGVPACATIMTLFILLLAGQSLTIFHIMALFLILGLGMDYVIFLNEMTTDRSATLQAIVLSALTSMLSFGLLSLSTVPVAQAFGLTVFIGNSVNLLATLALAGNGTRVSVQ